jgi:fumarate reductase iron-sulfur subunit
VERDLVTVIDDFIAKLAQVKPFLMPKEEKSLEAGEHRQTPAQLKRYKQFTLCINCMLCYAACPEYGLIPKYLGPAAITLAHRWNLDSRDGGREVRRQEIAATEGAWECSFVGACSEVCPEHVDPAGAIQQVKIESTVDWYQEHLMPWLKK